MICGFLVIDKPAGLSSHGCVSKVRKAYGLKKVGHGGTLDPAVTGVLPMALGPATRLLSYLPGDKTYRASIQLGVATSTDDLDGATLKRHPIPSHLLAADLEAALTPFRGVISQRPPAVSAVHVQGKRAYALARAGEIVELPPRTVTFHRIDLLAWDPSRGRVDLEICCTAGTYIRSLARDLGDALGCGAAMARLRRTVALGFDLSQSIGLEDLLPPLPSLLDPLLVLPHLPQHRIASEDLKGWCCGRAQQPHEPMACGQEVLVVAPDGKLAGLATVEATGQLQPRMVFDTSG